MDLSPFIAWLVLLAGLPISLWLAVVLADKHVKLAFLASSLTAPAIGVLLSIIAAALHGICIEVSFCTNRGDANMSYWFHAIFAIPLYWICIYGLVRESR